MEAFGDSMSGMRRDPGVTIRRRRRVRPLGAVIGIVFPRPFLLIGPAESETRAAETGRPAAPVGSWCTTSAVSGWPLNCPVEGPGVDNSSDTAAHGELSRLCV